MANLGWDLAAPGMMPAGGYEFNNPNFGNFASIFAPGNMPAEGTGNPIMPPALPEGSQVFPDWVGPYGANYGTEGYVPPPDPWANDPIGKLYGKSSGYQKLLNLSGDDMRAFLAQPGYHGDPNDAAAVLAYMSKFPAAVQDQMKPGGSLWGFVQSGWDPSNYGKGKVTSDEFNPWKKSPEQVLAAGQQWMTQGLPGHGVSGPGLDALQRYFADWFNKAQADNLGGLSLSGPPRPSGNDALRNYLAAMGRRQPMPDPWEQIQRNSYVNDVLGGNNYGGVIPSAYDSRGRKLPNAGPPPDPWTTLNGMGIKNPQQTGFAPSPWGGMNGPSNSFGASPWGK